MRRCRTHGDNIVRFPPLPTPLARHRSCHRIAIMVRGIYCGDFAGYGTLVVSFITEHLILGVPFIILQNIAFYYDMYNLTWH